MKRVRLTSILAVLLVVIGYILYSSQKSPPTPKQDPTKGVLSINIDKSVYQPGEKVYIQMASLDKNGDTLCDSNLKLTVNSQNLEVTQSPTCSPDNYVTNNPDYTSFFTPTEAGKYTLTLTNSNSSVSTSFEVSKDLPKLSISRWGPTRVNPDGKTRYPMVITVTAHQDYQGRFEDRLPPGFTFPWIGPAELTQNKNYSTLSWDINLSTGQKTELKYEYSVPPSTPKEYTIISPQFESRPWQLVTNL